MSYRKENETKIGETNTLLNEIKQKQSKVNEEISHAKSIMEESEKKLKEIEAELQILQERRDQDLSSPDSSPGSSPNKQQVDAKKLKLVLKEKQKNQKIVVEDSELALAKIQLEYSNLLSK